MIEFASKSDILEFARKPPLKAKPVACRVTGNVEAIFIVSYQILLTEKQSEKQYIAQIHTVVLMQTTDILYSSSIRAFKEFVF